MPNKIDATGLTVATQSELSTTLTTGMQLIYGEDIVLDSDTQDGQRINLFIQMILDLLDFGTQIYNTFDPDKAIGATLDARVAYNGIQRESGTFSVTNVTLLATQACALQGLDLYPDSPYTVQDDQGNQWQLQTTQAIAAPGSYVFAFQAANPGAIQAVPDTITSPVSVVLGISAINNPTPITTLGIAEESDAALRLRRQQSVAIGSQGFLDGLRAVLKNVVGVNDAFVFENVTTTTDVNGVPGNGIWVIVAGSPAAADVAKAIYLKRTLGCNMKGSQSLAVTQADGSQFVVYWDYVQQQNLWVQFNASSLDGVHAPNVNAIIAAIATQLSIGVNQKVNINALGAAVQQIDGNCLVYSAGFSATYGGSYTNTLSPTAKNYQFSIPTVSQVCSIAGTTVTPASIAGILANMWVYGQGITAGTYVAAVNTGPGTITLSSAGTTGSGVTLYFSTVQITVV